MTESHTPSGDPRKGGDESYTWSAAEGGESGRSAAGREWVGQLQSMIDNLATTAAPVIREIGAKAAELAALAGEKAGPIAHRAADVTATAGTKVAERGREVAAELRRDAGRNGDSASTGTDMGGGGTTGTGSMGSRPSSTPDSADSLGE